MEPALQDWSLHRWSGRDAAIAFAVEEEAYEAAQAQAQEATLKVDTVIRQQRLLTPGFQESAGRGFL